MLDPVIRGAKVEGEMLLSIEGKLAPFRDPAFERGHERGEQMGYAHSRREMEALITLLQTVSKKLIEQKERQLTQIKPQLIEFAMAVCEQVMRQELSHPETLVKLIDSLLTSVAPSLDGDSVKIVLAPEDLKMLESVSHGIRGVRFVSDILMARGDCRIETKTRLVNASIMRQLEDLRSKVLRQ